MDDETKISKNVEVEYMDITNRNAWHLVFQKIGRECQSYPYTFIEAKKPQNKALNRYRDVNPYDHSRIILKQCQKDYINANLVKMERANRKYILTQGPLMSTVGHFWLMVWEQQSRAILMLNKIIEKNEIKCHMYWPEGIGEEHKISFPDAKLSVEQISMEEFGYYTTRVFRIINLESEECREVIQFHYTTWPDFGVPTSPIAFINFLKKVRDSGVLEPDVGPAIVHCSAGIGRSGTFCLVDSCLVIIEKEGMNNLNIQEILLEMRKDRMGLIQTPDQLRFSYLAIIEGAKRLDPNWKEPSMEESIYSAVADEEEEEAPPAPPPRGASLPAIPAIPASMSLGDLKYESEDSLIDSSSSSDEKPPLPPERAAPVSPTSPASAASFASSASSADDEDDDVGDSDSGVAAAGVAAGEAAGEAAAGAAGGEALRRRRARALADRVSAMKKRVRDAERWHALKRFKSDENS